MLRKIFGQLVLVFMLGALTKTASAVNVNVMVLYTQDFANYNSPSLYISNAISYSNQAFISSGMDIRFLLRHHQVLNVANGSEVSQNLRDSLGSDSNVNSLRNTYRPDIVVYLTRASSSLCGIAYFPSYSRPSPKMPDYIETVPEMAFKGISVVGWNCAAYVFPHEIGHNLGGGHGPVDGEDHYGDPIRNSRGHGVRDVFRTIMTYPNNFGSAPQLAFHSNPTISYNGLPTGTSDRDNSSGMYSIAKSYVQNYSMCYPTVTSTVTDVRGGTSVVTSCGAATRYCIKWGDPIVTYTPRGGKITTPNCIEYNRD